MLYALAIKMKHAAIEPLSEKKLEPLGTIKFSIQSNHHRIYILETSADFQTLASLMRSQIDTPRNLIEDWTIYSEDHRQILTF